LLRVVQIVSITEKITRLIRPEIRALESYAVPDAQGLIKLDAMENPYPWPDEIKQAWLKALREVELNRYPDPGARALKRGLHAAMQVPENMGLLLGNGSDELIQIILMALARPDSAVLVPVPTFVMYEMIARAVGMQFIGVPLNDDFSLDVSAMREAMAQHAPAAVFLSYPNNPTGNLFSTTDVEAVLRDAPGLVILDEAYYPFSGKSFMDRIQRYDNLFVLRTLSKQGLAGLRLGMLAGDPLWLDELDKVRLPYNLGSLTQASAQFALTHMEIMRSQAQQICADREKVYKELVAMPGIRVWPSQTNFLLFLTENRDAGDVYDTLRRCGVLVKNLDPSGGVLKGCLRVTIGTPEENTAFVDALRKAL